MTRFVGVALAALLLAGCGTDRATTLDLPEATAAEEAEGPVSENAARAALLAIEDLPTGWTTAPAEEETSEATTDFCNQQPSEEGKAATGAEVSYSKGDFGDQLKHGVAVFEDAREAATRIEAFREAANACTEWPYSNEGDTGTIRLSPLSFPRLGHETLAFRMTLDVRSGELDISAQGVADVIILRRSNAVGTLMHFALGIFGPASLDSSVTEELARTADEKLRSAGY